MDAQDHDLELYISVGFLIIFVLHFDSHAFDVIQRHHIYILALDGVLIVKPYEVFSCKEAFKALAASGLARTYDYSSELS